MLSPDLLLRLPPAAALLVLSSVFVAPAASHAIPRQTRTVEYRELNVQPWPLATPLPTAAAAAAAAGPDLFPRQLNTICGYIGGDPDLPATCSAGSHCALDVEHGAVGCCPDGAPCTEGVYTGCVDRNSGPQTDINPYVYTCSGGDVCYQNKFDGGYVQYGCGSSSGMAATVAASASGREGLALTTMSVRLTADPTSLSEPTTLGTKTSGTKSSMSKTITSSDSSSTESETSTKESSTAEPSATHTAPPDAAADADAPDNNKGNSKNTGAIIGGTVGGVAFVAALITLGLCLWRRRKGNVRHGPGLRDESQYISPMSDTRHPFEPLPSVQEIDESQVPQDVPPARGHSADISSESNRASDEPVSAVSPYRSSASSAGGAAVGGSGPSEPDHMPLTREVHHAEMDNFSRGYNGGLDGVGGPQGDNGYGTYPGPRRGGGGGALWQQNRMQSRNLTWM